MPKHANIPGIQSRGWYIPGIYQYMVYQAHIPGILLGPCHSAQIIGHLAAPHKRPANGVAASPQKAGNWACTAPKGGNQWPPLDVGCVSSPPQASQPVNQPGPMRPTCDNVPSIHFGVWYILGIHRYSIYQGYWYPEYRPTLLVSW